MKIINSNELKRIIFIFIKYNNNFWEIKFAQKVSGIAPGQACVLYDINDKHLLGGSFI